MTASATGAPLRSSAVPLTAAYDVALVDLDGVVYRGPEPVAGAPRALAEVRAAGLRLAFVTNNAARAPEAVAAHLAALGIAARPCEVVTSAQAAATVAADALPPGAPVLVCGGEGLRAAALERGLRLVSSADDRPAAVLQGLSLSLTYADLAEATLAVRGGARWIAANGDTTLPTSRGIQPGNGALVAAVAVATGRRPVVCGKPEPPLFLEAVRRCAATRPLVVGDRLDTDIEGAVRLGLPSLLVLTGVTDARAAVAASPGARPTYLAADLSGLLVPHPAVLLDHEGRSARCGGWHVALGRDGWDVDGGGDPLDGLRAVCALAWATGDGGARAPLARLGLDGATRE